MQPADGKIVVIFATHNGAETLPSMLKAYCSVRSPRAAWSMVAVDNGSTDETPDILRRFADLLPLKILTNPVPGKNASLNIALRHVALDADLFIFTDDDAVPEADFLEQWDCAMRDFPDAELFAGTIEPIFGSGVPQDTRFRKYHHILFAENWKPASIEIEPYDVYGPNMAVRRCIFAMGATFREDIGPNNTQALYPMGSETEFCMRVAKEHKAQAMYVQPPKVGHIVKAKQLTRKYMAERAFRQGSGFTARMYADVPTETLPRPGLKGEIRLAALRVLAPISPRAYWRFHESQGNRAWLRARLTRG